MMQTSTFCLYARGPADPLLVWVHYITYADPVRTRGGVETLVKASLLIGPRIKP